MSVHVPLDALSRLVLHSARTSRDPAHRRFAVLEFFGAGRIHRPAGYSARSGQSRTLPTGLYHKYT